MFNPLTKEGKVIPWAHLEKARLPLRARLEYLLKCAMYLMQLALKGNHA